MQLCSDGEDAVTARFIRNELLWLDDEQNARKRHKDIRFAAPALMLCDWRNAAATADLLVLNRGYHSLMDSYVERQLQELNRTLSDLSSLIRGGRNQNAMRRR